MLHRILLLFRATFGHDISLIILISKQSTQVETGIAVVLCKLPEYPVSSGCDDTSTLEVTRDSPSATFNKANSSIEVDKGSQLGGDNRADALNISDSYTLTALR